MTAQAKAAAKKAAEYLCSHYEREQRYLVIFERDFESFTQSADWLKTQEAKSFQKYFDFLCCFENLQRKMKEFGWTPKFLKENGIDFKSIRQLYFAVK